MTSTFAEPRRNFSFGIPGAVHAIWKTFKLESEFGPCPARIRPNAGLDVQHQDLNETLHFLPPLDLPSFEHGPLPFSCRHFRPINVDKLQSQAERLGLQIPDSFIRLLREMSAHADLFSDDDECANQFYLDENPLLKVSYAVRRDGSSQTVTWADPAESQAVSLEPDSETTFVQGYLIRFYADRGGCYSWCLFLDSGLSGPAHMRVGNPGHCVVAVADHVGPQRDCDFEEHLQKAVEDKPKASQVYPEIQSQNPGSNTSPPTVAGLTPLEISQGVQLLARPAYGGPFTLIDTSFERWFQGMYYKALTWSTYFEDRKELDSGLRSYLGAIYGHGGEIRG